MSAEQRIVGLEATVAEQSVVIAELRAEVEGLKDRLGRDSGNSALPPSRDGKDRRQRRAAEREARKAARRDGAGETGRRPGKQPGSPGVTMRRREPDRTVTHAPVCCEACAADLAGAVVVGTATRQVVDIPDPVLVVTDHVAEKRRCSCGRVTTAAFPVEVTGPTCWGPGGQGRRGVSDDPPARAPGTSR
ncbi:MAG: IS66 family transposase zinc-finger binding domain-containing protein [Acidimicrobiales bacterium]